MPTETQIKQDTMSSVSVFAGKDTLSLQNDSTTVDSSFYYAFADSHPVMIPLCLDSVPSVEKPTLNADYFNQVIQNTDGYKVIELMSKASQQRHRELPSKAATPLKETIQTQSWFTPFMFCMFVLCTAGIAFSRHSFWRETRSLFFATYDDGFYDTTKEEFQNKFPLFLLFVVNLSLFAYFFINGEVLAPVNYFFVIFLYIITILLFSIAKMVLNKLVCYVFYDVRTYMKAENTFLLICSMIGIGLVPVLLIAAYAPSTMMRPALYVGAVLVFLLMGVYLLKMTTYFFRGTFSIFYLILYLCTVEILPFIALILGLLNILTA